MSNNPFTLLNERNLAIKSIIAATDLKSATKALDWIVEHRDHKIAHDLKKGDLR